MKFAYVQEVRNGGRQGEWLIDIRGHYKKGLLFFAL